jgi:hypothetical protein
MAVLDSNEIFYKAYEPKVQNRFVIFSDAIPSFMVRAAGGPSFEDEVITLHHINTYRKIRGKRTWGDIELTLYDPITPSAAQATMEWARLSYESVTGRAGYSDFYKKDMTFAVLGPAGDITSEWVLKGAFVSQLNQGSFDWSVSDPVDLTITLSMDYCVLNY